MCGRTYRSRSAVAASERSVFIAKPSLGAATGAHRPGAEMSPVSAPLAQRCICLWLLVFARLDETKAANLLHVPVTLEQRDEASQFYKVYNHDCKKCPAGSYVSKPCETPGSEGICYPCPNGTYNRHLTALPKCLGCTICRDLDQVELKPCTQTSDAVCVCKEGTFCSPSLPCETCHTCTARCLDGEVMVHPCTHESDIQCVKSASTTSSTSPAGSNQRSIGRALVAVAVAVVVAIAAIIWICKYWNNRNTTTDSHHNQETSCSLKTLLWRRRTYTRGQQVEQGHRTNAQVDQASPSQAIPQSLVDSSEGEPLHPAVQPEEGGQVTERPKKLVPANGRDPLDALRQSFEVFVSLVPIPDWKRFMRALGLTDNEIYRAEFSERDVNEQQFQMLRTWLEKNGKKATMDTLMKTLSDINLLRIVGDIRAALLLQDLYHED